MPNPEPQEKAANVIKKLGEVGYNKRVNISRAFGYLSDQLMECINQLNFNLTNVELLALGQHLTFDALSTITSLLEPLMIDSTWPRYLLLHHLNMIYFDINGSLFDVILRKDTMIETISQNKTLSLTERQNYDMEMREYIDQREVSILNVNGMILKISCNFMRLSVTILKLKKSKI